MAVSPSVRFIFYVAITNYAMFKICFNFIRNVVENSAWISASKSGRKSTAASMQCPSVNAAVRVICCSFTSSSLGALVDGRVLCVHGGIPSLDLKSDFFKLVSQIPCPLRDPETESPLAWELLWNDPLSNDMRDLENTTSGFTANARRGTGFFFSSTALNDFLQHNSLSYVVRAHEVQQQGFKVESSNQ